MFHTMLQYINTRELNDILKNDVIELKYIQCYNHPVQVQLPLTSLAAFSICDLP